MSHSRSRVNTRTVLPASDYDEAVGSPTPFLQGYGNEGGQTPVPVQGRGHLQFAIPPLTTRPVYPPPGSTSSHRKAVIDCMSPTGPRSIPVADSVPEWGSPASSIGSRVAPGGTGRNRPGWVGRVDRPTEQRSARTYPLQKPATCLQRACAATRYTFVMLVLAGIVSVFWVWPREVRVRVVEAAARFTQGTEQIMMLDVALHIHSDNYLPMSMPSITATLLHDVPTAGSLPVLATMQAQQQVRTGTDRVAGAGAKGIRIPARGDTHVVLQMRLNPADRSGASQAALLKCIASAQAGGTSACRMLLQLGSAARVVADMIPLPFTTVQLPLEVRG